MRFWSTGVGHSGRPAHGVADDEHRAELDEGARFCARSRDDQASRRDPIFLGQCRQAQPARPFFFFRLFHFEDVGPPMGATRVKAFRSSCQYASAAFAAIHALHASRTRHLRCVIRSPFALSFKPIQSPETGRRPFVVYAAIPLCASGDQCVSQ